MASFAAPSTSEWKDVLAGKTEDTYVVLRIEKKSISVVKRGKGLNDLIAYLLNEESGQKNVLSIGFVVYGIDSRGDVTSKRQKCFRVDWMGPKVSPMKRGLQLKCKSHVSEYFSSCNIILQSGDADDLSEKELTEQLLSSGGAHKPKCYDFGDGAKTTEELLTKTPSPIVDTKKTEAGAPETLASKMEAVDVVSGSAPKFSTATSIEKNKLVPAVKNEAQPTSKPSNDGNAGAQTKPFDATTETHAILLISSYGSGGGGQQAKCTKLRDTISALKIRFVDVDGADGSNKDKRNELFGISGIRGGYPQTFIQTSAGVVKFVGDYEKMMDLVESNDIPEDILKQNPGIETFNTVFSDCKL